VRMWGQFYKDNKKAGKKKDFANISCYEIEIGRPNLCHVKK